MTRDPITLPPLDRPNAAILPLAPDATSASYETFVTHPVVGIESIVAEAVGAIHVDGATLRWMMTSLTIEIAVGLDGADPRPAMVMPVTFFPIRFPMPMLAPQGTKLVFAVARHARGQADRDEWIRRGETWRLRVYATGRVIS